MTHREKVLAFLKSLPKEEKAKRMFLIRKNMIKRGIDPDNYKSES